MTRVTAIVTDNFLLVFVNCVKQFLVNKGKLTVRLIRVIIIFFFLRCFEVGPRLIIVSVL